MTKSKKIVLIAILISFLSFFPTRDTYAEDPFEGRVDVYLTTEDGLIDELLIQCVNIYIDINVPSGQYTVQDFFDTFYVGPDYNKGTTFIDILTGISNVSNGTWTDAEFKEQLGYQLTENDLLSLADFKGYSIDFNQLEAKLNETVIFTTDDEVQKFQVPFVKNNAKTTIHYQYEDGSKAADDYVVEGKEGLTPNVMVQSPTIDGYVADQPTVEVALNGIQEIAVTYHEPPLPTTDITIHFVDEKNPISELKSPVVLTKEIGSLVDLTKENIDTSVEGYLLKNQLDTSYEVKDSPNDIYLTYLKDATKADVTIHFVQADNHEIALKEPMILKNQTVGASIDLASLMIPKEIDNYLLTSQLDTAYLVKSGVNDIYLTYDTKTSAPPIVDSNLQQPTTTVEEKTNDPAIKTLPQTSEATNSLFSVFGILLASAGILFWNCKKIEHHL
ncbi:LPXTG cell wall anchor domain-containing protein [Isobaculum melis]|uniref:LPXTG-motif cell wall anchor domain-containing protein n=1 Tax=Isobaculum melis TaxID=142588 RepID=A0A1H9TKN5_9LACT|nr:MucBP domain-containing protein [Isobaculum melis]SER97765.1 LPXTG-motif cell wall anchor domain-containing protein [Isobaculum melis]